MAKIAKLITVSFVTRVIIDEKESEAKQNAAIKKAVQDKLDNDEGEVESVRPDLECPYGSLEGDTPKAHDLAQREHAVVIGVLNQYFEDRGDDIEAKKELMDIMLYDQNNIPSSISVEAIKTVVDDIDDFEAYLNALPEYNHIDYLYGKNIIRK